MAYTSDRPQFTVSIDSKFISEWQWAVHAVVRYRGLGLAEDRKHIEAEAQLELMLGIALESRRGRGLGARSVIVIVEGDREMAELFHGFTRISASPRVA